MTTPTITHVGILVENLEEAIERWSRLTGWDFTTVMRFEPHSYTCKSFPEPHAHSQRIAFSLGKAPFVELLEVNPDEPTHDASQLGLHHIAFDGVEDIAGRLKDFTVKGIETDGHAFGENGDSILFFPDASHPEGFGVRVEIVKDAVPPINADDGGPIEFQAPGITYDD
jgi:catechol 2,3-dioxygenase-like lactoylglutathione lyase family enzyme